MDSERQRVARLPLPDSANRKSARLTEGTFIRRAVVTSRESWDDSPRTVGDERLRPCPPAAVSATAAAAAAAWTAAVTGSQYID